MSFEHFVISRFNLGRTDDAFFRYRLALLEAITLPCVRAQTASHRWLLMIDPETPETHWRQLEKRLVGSADLVRDDGGKAATHAIDSRLSGDTSHVIMTRLDTDDAIHRNFLTTIQGAFAAQDYLFVNLPLGVRWDCVRERCNLKKVRNRPNQFVSLIRSVEREGSVYDFPHTRCRPFINVRTWRRPMWVWTLHATGSGQLNNVLGRNALKRLEHRRLRWRSEKILDDFDFAPASVRELPPLA